MNKKIKDILYRYIPIFVWLPNYKKAWLTGDIIAGFSVWAIVIPLSIGIALISGIPIQHGIYAVIISSLVFPIFASSRLVITGPATSLAAITGTAVYAISKPNTDEAVQLVATITFLAGIIYLIFAIFKMGWISNFLSDSVLTGFIFGIGISIVISQLHNITGTTESGANAWLRVASWVQGFPSTSLPTLAVGLSTLIFLVVLRLYVPKFPGALLAMALGIGAELLFHLSDYGVATLDPVARGLPVFSLPDQTLILGNLGVVIPAAVSVFFVAMSASLAAAREYASQYHYDIDINQELLAQGAANTANGLFQGMGVYGYIGGTNMSVASGGRSEVPSLVLGVLTVLTMLFFAPIFSYLPLAVLGAVLIEVVYFGLWKIPQMKRLWNMARTEFWLALAAMLGVLTFGILEGMLIGVALSLLWLIWRTSHPAVPELGKMPHSLVYHSLSRYPDSETHPGIIIIRFDGPIFFATASRLRENIRQKITDPDLDVKAVILDMESTNIIDLEGSAALHQVAKELKSAGIDFHLVRTKSEIIEVLGQDGVLDTIGRDNLLDYVHEAVDIINARMEKGGLS